MEKIWNWIQLGVAALGGWLGWILGGLDGFLYALIAFVVIDYITGVMCAVVDKKLSSEVGFKGIFKKVLIFAMVAVGHTLDTHILQTGSALRTAVNVVRGYYGLAPVSWNEEVTAGKTGVKNWPFHILEIRRAIEPIITTINGFDTVTTFDVPSPAWLPIGTGRPRADVMAQIQSLLLSL